MAFSITGITMLMLSIFVVAALGYMLGRINIKGVSLGTAGVFIVALIFGAVFPTLLSGTLTQTKDYKVNLPDQAEIGIVEKEKNGKNGEKEVEYYLSDVKEKEAEEGAQEAAEEQKKSEKAKAKWTTPPTL